MSGELIESFLTWKRGGQIAETTIAQRRSILRQIDALTPLEVLTAEQATAWLTDARRGPHAARQGLNALRTFYRWANASGLVQGDPTALLHPIREPHGLPDPTPATAIAAALKHADEPTRAAVMLGYRAGLRPSEITRFHSDQITPDGLRITGKGRRVRVVPVHPDLRPYIDVDGWRFPSPRWPERHAHQDTVTDRITAATGHRAHGLRHRFATDFYTQTRDLRALQMLLGHGSILTTQRYIALADEHLTSLVHGLT